MSDESAGRIVSDVDVKGALRRIPVSGPTELRSRGYALIDPGSGKLIAGPFPAESEAKQARRRLGMGRVELVEVTRG